MKEKSGGANHPMRANMCSQRRQINGVECELQKWHRFIRITTKLFLFWYYLLDYAARILDRYNIQWGKLGDEEPVVVINSIGERTSLARRNSLCRQNSQQCLLRWVENDINLGSEKFHYDSFTQMISYMVRGCARSAYLQFLAGLLLQNPNLKPSLNKLTKTFTKIQRQSAKTVKFRFFFKALNKFLKDVEQGKGENMSHLLRIIADDITTRRCTWWLEFEHGFLRCSTAHENVYETTLAIFSIFFRHGANFDNRGLANIRSSPRRLHDGMLTLLMICAVERTTLTLANEINVTEFGGTDRILLSSWKDGFQRAPSPKVKVSDGIMKDILMWNAMLNECSEYVECSWSVQVLSRAMWALQWGRKFVERNSYDELMAVIEQDDDNTDLTGFDARALLVCVIAGVVQCPGNGNGTFFSMVGVADASRNVRGRLPSICIQDLIDIHVLRCIEKNKYVIDLPDDCCRFNAKDVDGHISFFKHSSNMHFSALPTQTVQ